MSAAVLALAGAACSPAANDDDSSGGNGPSGKTKVTFRLWDEQVAKAYEKSFAEFEKTHKNIDVSVELIPWADYWTRLPNDVASGDMADIFWTNTANFATYADNGDLVDVDAKLGASAKSKWKQSVVDIYTRDGKLWGVPQLWDSIALFYNKNLVAAAGVDPTSLKWSPAGGAADTFLPAAQKLTLDQAGKSAGQPGFDAKQVKQWGFNSALDSQAIYLDFVGSNGGVWQQGDTFALRSPQTVAGVQYAVDLINKQHVSPSAADTNQNGEKTRDLFVQGKLAMYQSGPYRLKDIQENAKFDWAIAPMLEGPAGRVSAVHGVAAVGYAKTKHLDATVEVMKWLGSAEGQKAIAEGGYAFPGVTAAEQSFLDYWADQKVDVTPFVTASEGKTIPAQAGPNIQAGLTAMTPVLEEIFLGRKPVQAGLAEAEKAANDAVTG
ncbi:ABC transporter substrate-binding protein [Flindersiella endophytica]